MLQTVTNSSDIKISRTFATPIALHRPQWPAHLDIDLASLILAAEQRTGSSLRSNIGGWRSGNDLLEWPHAAITDFSDMVSNAVGQLIRAAVGPVGFDGVLKLSAWANLLRHSNYNTLHAHPESAWSGVYYVDVGDATTSDALSGVLELRDPRPGVEMVPAPGWPFGNPLGIAPETGLMVLFPSWLYHQVHPYLGQRPRLSIAFNASTQARIIKSLTDGSIGC